MQQKTLVQPVSYSGVGIHSGIMAEVTIKPAPVNQGIVFVRIDLPERPRIPVDINYLEIQDRCTILKNNSVRVQTVEHLLATIMMIGLSNATIEINSEEFPILDGSARPIFDLLCQAGLIEQNQTVRPLEITAPVFVENDRSTLVALPADKLEIFCFLDFPGSAIGRQTSSFNIDENFGEVLAPARTFGFWHEIESLRSRGLARGGTLDNALIVGEKAYSSVLRFPDEPARHKIVDIIGDLALLKLPLQARIIALKPGHLLNCQLAIKILDITSKTQIK